MHTLSCKYSWLENFCCRPVGAYVHAMQWKSIYSSKLHTMYIGPDRPAAEVFKPRVMYHTQSIHRLGNMTGRTLPFLPQIFIGYDTRLLPDLTIRGEGVKGRG